MLKYYTIQILLFNAYMMVLWNIRVLVLLNHRSIILVLVLVSIMFAYAGCEDERSFDFELCLSINSINALGNNQEYKTSFL